MSVRRSGLSNISHNPSFHPGLWLQRYLGDGGEASKATLIRETTGCHEPPDYAGFYQRWKEGLQTLEGIRFFNAESPKYQDEPPQYQRLVVGMGAESVLENAITLHHVYGVPYLPGSALKGVASSYALYGLDGAEWGKTVEEKGKAFRKAGNFHLELFGDTKQQGVVTFFDALPLPRGSTPNEKPKWTLHPDIMTPHHNQYYGSGKDPPADWDSPVPAPFISASGTFLVALQGPEAWVKIACQILRLGLEKEGIGAKTSSGYGRLLLNCGR